MIIHVLADMGECERGAQKSRGKHRAAAIPASPASPAGSTGSTNVALWGPWKRLGKGISSEPGVIFSATWFYGPDRAVIFGSPTDSE